jgi:hypothetical protein
LLVAHANTVSTQANAVSAAKKCFGVNIVLLFFIVEINIAQEPKAVKNYFAPVPPIGEGGRVEFAFLKRYTSIER